MKRITVYPEPRSLRILGHTTPQLNLALDCWAAQVARGAAEAEALLTRPEWLYLADCLNGHTPDAREDGASLALCVHDAQEYDGIGGKWFESEVHEHVEELKAKFLGLTYPAVWAVFSAVSFFWENHGKLDIGADEWWRASFRTRWNQDEKPETE